MAVVAALPVPAAAEACVGGSAYLASAVRPHQVDVRGDAGSVTSPVVGGRDALDLLSLWIGVEDPNLDLYSVNVAVADLTTVPVGTAYFVEFAEGDRPWVSATKSAAGEWQYASGTYASTLFFVGSVYEHRDKLVGRADEEAGILSIVLPRTIVTAADVASDQPFVAITASSNTSTGNPAGFDMPGMPSLRMTTDHFNNGERCAVYLQPPEDGD